MKKKIHKVVVHFQATIAYLLVAAATTTQATTVCHSPAVPINTKVTIKGGEAIYECDEGYTLFGPKARTCNAKGEWEGDLPTCATNIAYQRPANQSTTVGASVATKANDGIKSVNHEGSECSVTNKEFSPWWRVNLLQPYEVVVVVVSTPACCDSPALQNIEIRVGNSLDIQRNSLCAWEPGTVEQGKQVEFKCASPLKGQYVVIQMVGRDTQLSLCEVEVYSTEEFAKERCATTADIATVGIFNKTCYQFNVEEGKSFDKAREFCKNTHSFSPFVSTPNSNSNSSSALTRPDLAHTLSSVELNYVITELKGRESALKIDLIWIGARKEPGFVSRTWKWTDGTVVEKPSWGRGQPNNYNGKQDCVALDRGRGWKWNDVGCDLDYLPFVCMYAPNTCGSPDLHLNTTIIATTTTTKTASAYPTGTIIHYSCPLGSKVEGENARICMHTGFWNGSAPTCKYIDCGPPPIIENGIFTYANLKKKNQEGKEGESENINRTTYQSTITYSCHTNYSIQGSSVRVCGEDSMWTPTTIPKCLYARCPALPTPPHATIQADVNSNSAGGTVTYKCEPGYVLAGDEVVSCQLGGSWSSLPPSCEFRDCGVATQPRHGTAVLVNSTTTYGSQVTYQCENNYRISGPSIRLCGKDGNWEGQEPECVLITCGEPTVPLGGYVTGYSFQVGSVVKYHCDEGYRMEVEKETKISQNIERGQNEHQEEKGRIPEQIHSEKGEIQGKAKREVEKEDRRETYRKKRRIKTEVKDVYARTCSLEGTWSGTTPMCVYTDCGRIEEEEGAEGRIKNGKIIYKRGEKRTNYLSLVEYECDKGYKLKGNKERECTREAVWSGSTPVCEEIRCLSPPQDEGENNASNRNSSIGYALLKFISGNDKRIPSIYNPTRRRGRERWREREEQERQNYRVGSVATYECPRGYVVMESGSSAATTSAAKLPTATTISTTATTSSALLTCTVEGKWSGKVPTCAYVDCGMPEKVVNGYFRLLSNTTHFGSLVAYECSDNYKVEGRIRRHCLSNGTWVGQPPMCKEIQCSNLSTSVSSELTVEIIPPPSPPSQLQQPKGASVGSRAHYQCQKGYRLSGNIERTCNSNGVWSGRPPICQLVMCEPPLSIGNGRVVPLNESLSFGAIVEFHCVPEYRLFGPFVRTCTENGNWSDIEPKCVGKEDEEYNLVYPLSSDSSSSSSSSDSGGGSSSVGVVVGVVMGLLLVVIFVVLLLWMKMKQRRGGGGGGREEWKMREEGGRVGVGMSERPPLPPPNEQKTPTITYSNLTDPITGNNIYENIEDAEEEEEEERRENTNNYHNNNNNHYENTTNTPVPPCTAATTTNTTTAGINRTRNSSKRPRLPPPKPPTIPDTDITTTTAATIPTANTSVTINGVTISGGV